MIDWKKVSKEETELAMKIVERIEAVSIDKIDRMSTMMDIEATHIDCPLDLQGLLDADFIDFSHDIMGIRQHLNRETGKLEGGFVPRYALNQKGDA